MIDFLKERVNRQSESRQAITAALTEYDVGAENLAELFQAGAAAVGVGTELISKDT